MGLAGFFRYALCKYHLGKLDEVRHLLEVLVRERPYYEPYYRLLLGIYEESKSYKEARALKTKLKRAQKTFKKRMNLDNYLDS